MEGKENARFICDACGVKVGNSKKHSHFKKEHPEFKFHLEKKGEATRVICDGCAKAVDSYGELVKSHRHLPVPIPESKPTDPVDKLISNAELILKRHHELEAEIKVLRTLVGTWETRAAKLNDDISSLLHRETS